MERTARGAGLDDTAWLLFFCASRMGFALIGTVYAALIPLLRPAWQMSAGEAGSVQSAWHAGYIVSLVVASQLAGRYGAKRTFLGMGVAACASALLFALGATDYRSACLLYGLAGLCAGGSYVPGLTLIAERFSPTKRGRAMGAYIAAASLGYAFGLVGASALAARAAGGDFSAPFLLGAAAALFGLALAVFTLRGTPNLTPAAGRPGALLPFDSLGWLWRNKPARLVILAYALHAWELLGLWAWLPAYLSAAVAARLGDALPLVAAGATLAALTHLISMAGSLAGGSWSDRFGRRRVILGMSLCSAACALLFGWLFGAPLWLLMPVAVLFNLAAIGDSAIYSAALTETVPARHLAAAYSLRSILGFGMGALSPWLFGQVLDAAGGRAGQAPQLAWGLAWSALGAVALLGPWLTWRWRQDHRHGSNDA